MLKQKERKAIERLLGTGPVIGDWCRLATRIPRPPKEVWAAAGRGPLRPGRIPLVEALMYPLVALVVLPGVVGVLLADLLFEVLPTAIRRLFFPRRRGGSRGNRAERREAARAERNEAERKRAAIKEHRLDELFDGDWQGAAGQLLLRWYGQSRHGTRLVLLVPGRIVLAAPRRRVWRKAAKRARVVAEIPASEAVVEDPLHGGGERGVFRLLFRDGSWLVLRAIDPGDRFSEVLREGEFSSPELPVRV
ncbi:MULTISPECIES: hypothetical protein [unclassified Streptomyces]|uniref:hypothetical protein n=1 Tax=unclassified Streptomyces TaxID=2593676 RepID=UPI001318FE8F|nr:MULTISPECIES: hypothetical protein [unclassified Streptomyces]QHC15836.1 hypothetical protein GR131_10490 [Streptomyces sp. GF20]